MKQVPFFDLKKQNTLLAPSLQRIWDRMLTNTDYILGAEVENFEKNFAQYIGVKYAVGVSTGLDALSLSLKVLGIGPKDEVIIPANTFIATALAVSSVGAKPVLVDIRSEDYLMDSEKIERVISKKTKAMMPVHLYGQPVDVEPLRILCRDRGLFLVEDAAQAHGADLRGKKCGGLGDLGAFSFYPSKNLGAFGDGGMITTDRSDCFEKLLELRNYGSRIKYQHRIKGFNMRLDTLQAAVLNVKLAYLDEWNQRRIEIAKRYLEKLSDRSEISCLKESNIGRAIFHLFIIQTSQRDSLKEHLSKHGISTGIHYPIPIHLQDAYQDLSYRQGDFPITEEACNQILSLPIYPEMELTDVDYVCESIHKFFHEN